jgi:hypothetical protein
MRVPGELRRSLTQRRKDAKEARIKNEELEQEQTEEKAEHLFPLLSPVSSSVFLFYLCSSVANGCQRQIVSAWRGFLSLRDPAPLPDQRSSRRCPSGHPTTLPPAGRAIHT